MPMPNAFIFFAFSPKVVATFEPRNRTELLAALHRWAEGAVGARAMYGDITIWNTSSIGDMSKLLEGFVAFNEPIGSWNTARVKTMADMFANVAAFNQPLATWNTSSVQFMGGMFRDAGVFNQPVGEWNTSSVQCMEGMFKKATAFDQHLDRWNTANVKTMSHMFHSAIAFNRPVGLWDTTRVIDMRKMFFGARAFDQSIGSWNTGSVTSMYGIFQDAAAFNQPIGGWTTDGVTTMSYMFRNAIAFDQPLGTWNTARVSQMRRMFGGAIAFNHPIGRWNTVGVTTLARMFVNAEAFDQPLETWNTARVANMNDMFMAAISFNQPVGHWELGNVHRMRKMFHGAIAFNQPIGNWNTAEAIIMGGMFAKAGAFNQPIGEWSTARVTNMMAMFTKAAAFNQPVGSWNTAAVSSMAKIFYGASSFFQDISSWRGSPSYSHAVASLPSSPTINGYIILAMSNASKFVKEPHAVDVLEAAIAAAFKVDMNTVQNVTMSLVQTGQPRVLSDTSAEGPGNVRVDYTIGFAPDGAAVLTVTALVEDFNTQTLQSASDLMNSVIDHMTSSLSGNYSVTVVRHVALDVNDHVSPSPFPPESTSDSVVVISVVVIALVIVGCSAVLLVSKGRPRPQRTRRQSSPTCISQLLCPPDSISSFEKESVHSFLTDSLNLSTRFQSDVFISFAIGRRDNDVSCSGPGIYYAAAVCMALMQTGLYCYGSFVDQTTAETTTGVELLLQQYTRIKLMVVLETRAFYNCKQCLEELHAAFMNGIEVVRLRFEDFGSAAGVEYWPEVIHCGNITSVSGDSYPSMVAKVSLELGLKAAEPPPPMTVQSCVNFLDAFAVDSKQRILLMSACPRPVEQRLIGRAASDESSIGHSECISHPLFEFEGRAVTSSERSVARTESMVSIAQISSRRMSPKMHGSQSIGHRAKDPQNNPETCPHSRVRDHKIVGETRSREKKKPRVTNAASQASRGISTDRHKRSKPNTRSKVEDSSQEASAMDENSPTSTVDSTLGSRRVQRARATRTVAVRPELQDGSKSADKSVMRIQTKSGDASGRELHDLGLKRVAASAGPRVQQKTPKQNTLASEGSGQELSGSEDARTVERTEDMPVPRTHRRRAKLNPVESRNTDSATSRRVQQRRTKTLQA